MPFGEGNVPMLCVRWRAICLCLAIIAQIVNFTGCKSSPRPAEKRYVGTQPPAATDSLNDVESAGPEYALKLPANFNRHVGDWDELRKSGVLRLLVLYNKTGFFYDKGRPRGVIPDIADELEVYLNKKLKTGAKKFKVVFIPVTPARLEKDLNEGFGDIIASPISVTPEREKRFDFSIPIISGLKLVVVSGKDAPQVSNLDDLSGKEIYVNRVSVAYDRLREQNQKFKQAGKPEIVVKESDPNLTEEDLLEMTNAGVIPATVAFDYRADLWSAVLPNIVIDHNFALMNVDSVAWAMRKNSPQLKALMNDFLKTHRQGTVFGRVMFNKYLANKKFIKNATSQAEIRKFKLYVEYFKKYGTKYNFDYLMLAAQGYQESMLQQDRVSPRGAVGIMQVLPQYAAASPINIPNVRNAESNIHAGAKMLAMITKTYFNDPAIGPVDKTLFTFASYNAGPNRIVRLRKQAAKQGLDPNKWFGNVELMVAKDIGQETVQYVANVYKYYVAYKMAIAQQQVREAAKSGIAKR
jgi:membrane-bound lytic murein transglycosylase MltF